MNTNEVKKALYKEKPVAYLSEISKDGISYMSILNPPNTTVRFLIPFSDIGDAKFGANMPSQLLIRWLITE